MESTPTRSEPRPRSLPPAAVAPLLGLVAISFAIASAIHFGVALGPISDPFPGAKIPEAILAVIAAAGAITVAAKVRGSRWFALAATAISIAGVLFGLSVTLGSAAYGDIAYHFSVLVLLVVTLVVTFLPRRLGS